MHLKSITVKGFKSFPDRTRLEFGEGVSVVVGPNGSGKSNITDAVLWALGEQSASAVRGQSMQDVIFAGGRGVQARSEAEVELVLDNGDGTLDLPVSELSIMRRLNRAGEGEYRLNGARCRLIDVLELLSGTGLGKEAHSVISQGRVESIVTSKPRDRRLLIEEAAGLGKHRKRRRRAQLKLERTGENLNRALDIEREARTRLRPLKAQAEAAEQHQRLERQSLEARWTLARDDLAGRLKRLAEASLAAEQARGARDALQGEIEAVAGRREAAELALAQRSERHDAIARSAYGARSAHDAIAMRLERSRSLAIALGARGDARATELTQLAAQGEAEDASGAARIEQLEAELEALAVEREARLASEVAALASEAEAASAQVAELDVARERARALAAAADSEVASARTALHECERAVERARREAARVGAELAGVNQFLRVHGGGDGAAAALESRLHVEPGYELALAAALGGRLGAWVASDRGAAAQLLDGAGQDGGSAFALDGADAADAGAGPGGSAQALLSLVHGDDEALAVLARLLANTWVVDELAALPKQFSGTAVTRAGRVWNGALGELSQAPSGGRERALAERNRRDALIEESARVAAAEQDAIAAGSLAEAAVQAAVDAREAAEAALRAADREHAEALERERRAAWLIEQRRNAPDQGEHAVRRAQLEGELGAERRAAERADRERRAQAHRRSVLRAQGAADAVLIPQLERYLAVLEDVGAALAARRSTLEAELAADSAAGETLAGELRTCAGEEAALQARMRVLADALTSAEVGAQQARDQAADREAELRELAQRLGLEATAADVALSDAERVQLADRVARLARRREQLGAVNPLAAEEYREALERVAELEAQREDLETALRELRRVIRDTDRQISESFAETFNAAAQNFEELVEDVFPGGRGRLRLVRDESAPRPLLAGADADADADAQAAEADAEREADADEAQARGDGPDDDVGVEIELTPAGKSMKRLSLLSGGEKSMTAIAFLFAVFLARPCPFYILDEVEAALDDLNIDRFLALLRRHSSRAQFIVVTHQKRTMEAADWLYGVSMGNDGTSKVVSRRLGDTGLSELDIPLRSGADVTITASAASRDGDDDAALRAVDAA